MRATAYIAVRNGAEYLETCLSHLARNGVSSVVIDNASDDATPQILRRLVGEGRVQRVHHLPFDGEFQLRAQLQLKHALIDQDRSDWVLHLDVDEMPHSARPGESLLDALVRADHEGYNAINFEEFVFLPLERDYAAADDGWPPLHHYYFFAPAPQRLLGAWRRDAGANKLGSGGHALDGPALRISPEDLLLRHYPFLSLRHARTKYLARRFDPSEIEVGWHVNRIGLTPEQMEFPSVPELERLERPDSIRLDRSRPRRAHYWQWRETASDAVPAAT